MIDNIIVEGHNYRVIYTNDLDLMEGKLGSVDFIDQVILIRDSISKGMKQSVLLHEIIHIIEQNHNIDLEEKDVKSLQSGLYQTLKENKLRF